MKKSAVAEMGGMRLLQKQTEYEGKKSGIVEKIKNVNSGSNLSGDGSKSRVPGLVKPRPVSVHFCHSLKDAGQLI